MSLLAFLCASRAAQCTSVQVTGKLCTCDSDKSSSLLTSAPAGPV